MTASSSCARGLTPKQIRQEVGVSERQCARILEERKLTDRFSRKLPAVARKGVSIASTTELLDELQKGIGDLAALARRAPTFDLGLALRLEVVNLKMEYVIDELRHRSAEFAAPTRRTSIAHADQGSPPTEADMS
jgi:hypothetical protein